VTAQRWDGFAIGPTLLGVLLVAGCAVGDDPKRTFSLRNDTGDPRLVRRCHGSDRVPERCRRPENGELIEPGEALTFKVYFDERRTYVVGDAQGTTLGCVSVHVADGTGGYPESLSDLEPCPAGTPRATE
jgi:hypothetical protein